MRVVIDVRRKVGSRGKLNSPIDFDKLKTALQVEINEISENDVVTLWQKKADHIAAIGRGGTKVLCAQLNLFLAANKLLNCHCLRRKRIVVVAIMEIRWVLEDDLENVVGRVTKEIVAGVHLNRKAVSGSRNCSLSLAKSLSESA